MRGCLISSPTVLHFSPECEKPTPEPPSQGSNQHRSSSPPVTSSPCRRLSLLQEVASSPLLVQPPPLSLCHFLGSSRSTAALPPRSSRLFLTIVAPSTRSYD
ncbi:hypothetical protein PIB30_084123 [Stylosanthes scabra]|uniref:Uncharacterized protein n=1 Tax=Stylosanthes scabra TaxID=79078 RepID=A0ABU6WVY4_9FABA|nr:hypothetical protein [Stylosanthes scabra]